MGKTVKWIEKMIGRIDTILKNRIIAALFLLIQGIGMILHPERTAEGGAKSLATAAVIAAALFIINEIFSRDRKRSLHGVIGAVFLLILGIYCYIRPAWLTVSLRYVIALIMLSIAVLNLLRFTGMNRLAEESEKLRAKQEDAFPGVIEPQIAGELQKSLQETVKKNLEPTLKLIGHLGKTSAGLWAITILMLLMAALLLVFPFETNASLSVVSGGAMLLGAVSELLTALKLKKIRIHDNNTSKEGAGNGNHQD